MVQSGKIGKVCDVEACFTRLANIDSRERTDAAYGGAFLEFGSYTLLPIIKLLGTDYRDIHFDTIYDENGVDLYTKVYMSYDNAMALSKNGVAVKSEGQLVIAGTKGYILAPYHGGLQEDLKYITKTHQELRCMSQYFREMASDMR